MEFRSPLVFYDGDSVKTIVDWVKRRKEIIDQRHEMMGKWTPLINNQKVEYLETILLIPDGKGTKPAIIAVFYEPETDVGMGGNPYRDFAYQLAKRSFVTLSIGIRKASVERYYSLYHPSLENAQVQPLSMLDYAAANAWNVLSKVDGVD